MTDKKAYTCYQCDATIVATQQEAGTVPVFISCVALRCDGQMYREYGPTAAIGKQPTYKLVRDPESKTDKLKLEKLTEGKEV